VRAFVEDDICIRVGRSEKAASKVAKSDTVQVPSEPGDMFL